jgi:hypothetical protein
MTELGWTASEVMQEHLQNLVSQGYMMAAELANCHVPEDPTSPIQAGRYVMACTTFYERGFGVTSHQFLHSLLQFFDLELRHLTPSGILLIAAFVTLCKPYIGIEPHFNLWNYFFCVGLQQGSGMEMSALGNVDIFVRSGPVVDPYFHLRMSDPPVGWRKVWFFLKNDANVSLPVFMGSRPIPQPKWGYGVIQKDLCRLQLLHDVVQRLL